MSQLLIYSRAQPDGTILPTWLLREGEGYSLREEGSRTTPLTLDAILAVFARYGRPLDADITDWVGELPLTTDATIKSFRFMNWGDVYKTDYLGLFQRGQEALAAPSPLIAAALRALSLAIMQKQSKR